MPAIRKFWRRGDRETHYAGRSLFQTVGSYMQDLTVGAGAFTAKILLPVSSNVFSQVRSTRLPLTSSTLPPVMPSLIHYNLEMK
jgi:hypothetical protein